MTKKEEWLLANYNSYSREVYFFKFNLFITLKYEDYYRRNIIQHDNYGTYFSIAVQK